MMIDGANRGKAAQIAPDNSNVDTGGEISG